MKYKYLIPRYINAHFATIDFNKFFVDQFFKGDDRMPLVMVTQFGIFPTKGQYSDKPKKDIRLLEGLENQNIAFFRRTYLTNNEEDGLVILYADEVLVEDQRTFVSNINRRIKK